MRHPDVFEALADHSGDSNFELCYMQDFPTALDAYRDAGGPKKWLDAFWADENRRRGRYMKPLDAIGMAAHYSPNPQSPHMGIDFPFDLETGEFKWDVWERWRAWDPVRMVDKYADNLRKLKKIYVDCGTKDEFSLVWGARALVARMRAAGLQPHYEEFDDGHMNIAYRYDRSVPLLVEALS
jgi:S-formylglutathione hydrolase FrmB